MAYNMTYDINDKILTWGEKAFRKSAVLLAHHTSLAAVLLVVMMMFVGVGEMWGATVTYHIINLGRLDDSGHLTHTRTEALKFTVSGTTTVGNTTLDKYKSPLAKNWQYYSSSDVSYNTSTKVCTFTGGPSLTESSVLSANADVYVTYELDEDAFSTVGVFDGGIFKIKFPNNLYLRQTMYGAEINTDSQPIPDSPTSDYLWKFNIVDPYQITIQSQSSSYLDYYLSNQTGKKDFANIRLQPTLAAAKGTYTWAFGLLSGGADGTTYRLIVADGITASGNQLDSFGHGYLNNKRDNYKTTYHLYNTTSYERCDLTIEPLSVNYTFHIINNSGEEAMSKQTSSAENAGATIAESMIPDILKSPAACNYSFYPTAADAADGTNAITRLPVDPTDPINDDVYVRYETSSGGINLNGEIKYNLSVGGAHYLYAADATTIDCEAASDADDTYRWRLLGGDPYKFTIENVYNNQFVTYDISGGEAVTLSETGSNFFLHQTTSGSYELVAIPSNDYPTSYYTLGYDGTLKLCSSTFHSFEDPEIQTVFTEIFTAIIDPLPTANDLTYNGLLQALVTAGTCANGTIKYSEEGPGGEYSTTIPTKKDAGTYSVYYMSVGNPGYEDYVAVNPITVTIAPAPVTVTAENKTKVYGEADPTLTATVTGLISGESESLITYTLSRTEDGENAGNYTITPDGDALQGNYEVSFVTGTLTIGMRIVGITWGETSFDYTGSPHVPTATATNLVYGDEIGITVTGEKTNVGNYTATASALTGTKKSNYQLPAAADKKTSFSIVKASINTSIEMTEWSYGDYDASTNSPSLSYNPENLTITYRYKVKGEDDETYAAAVPTAVGTYTLQASLPGTDNSYAQVLTKDFTISQKALSKSASGRPANGITITVSKNTGTIPPTYDVTVTHNFLGTPTALTPFDAEHPENPYDYTLSGESGVSGYVVTVTAKMEGDEYTGNYTGIVKAAYAEPTFYLDGAPSGDEYAAVYLGLYDVLPSPVGGSEIKAYIVNKVNPTVGTISVSPVESPTVTNYIPEDVPVLLLSNNENLTGFQISSTTEDTSDITAVAGYNNQLRIAPEGGVPVEDTEAYVFYRGEFVLTKKGTISPGKFFLYNPNYKASVGGGGGGPSPVRRYLRIVMEEDEDPTGMDNGLQTAVNGPLNDLWYTLDGRRLDGKPTRKGIYITNGKKHIIK